MAQRTTQAPFCPVCGTTYSRVEHLQRHLASHTDNYPHSCQSCGKSFKRQDVLKRHYATCPANQNASDSSAGSDKRSKTYRKACDRCVRLKRACNSATPCETCALRKSTCTYSWLNKQSLETSVSATQPDVTIAEILPTAPQIMTIGSQKTTDIFVEEVEPVEPSHTHQTHRQHRVYPLVPTSDEENDECHSPDLVCSADTSDLEDDPAESFDFLARFTSNDSGMSGAFDVDSNLVAQASSSMEYSGDNSSYLSSRVIEESRTNLFERYSKNARRHSRQVNLESHNMQEVLPFMGTLDIERREELFFTSLRFETCMSSSSPLVLLTDSRSRRLSDSCVAASSGTLSSTLALKSHEIVVALKATVKLRGSDIRSAMGDWSTLKESACIHFFQPNNLSRYLEYYWVLWYPNWPTIHRPSFKAATSPCQLLAAMALIGASLSPHSSDRENAKVWLDVVEEMVFSDETTIDSRTSTTMQSCPPGQLEARLHSLQAAYAVCLYQNWEGGRATKERIRRQRFGLVISMARDLMRHANHNTLREFKFQDFSWETFVLHEQLIRTIMYVFLLDTAFTIFNNLPPRMIIREMTNDLACPEPCFQAATAEECCDLIRKWTAHPLHPNCTSLYAAIRCFRQKIIEPATQRYLADTGVLNLWTIVSAFHNFIFHIDPGFGSESQFAAMENAIANWRVIWRLRPVDGLRGSRGPADLEPSETVSDQNEAWKRMGFMRQAPEYWLLARVKLKRLSSTQRSLEAAERLSGFNNWLCNVPGTILPKYDETSMEQLSELISSFSAMRVEEDVDRP